MPALHFEECYFNWTKLTFIKCFTTTDTSVKCLSCIKYINSLENNILQPTYVYDFSPVWIVLYFLDFLWKYYSTNSTLERFIVCMNSLICSIFCVCSVIYFIFCMESNFFLDLLSSKYLLLILCLSDHYSSYK